jgi:hypothetical protein
VGDEPASDNYTASDKDGQNGQPVPLPPPEDQQEANAEDDAGDLASIDVETAKDEKGADERGAQITCGQGDAALSAEHARLAALAGIEGDTDNFSARADGGEGVAELVEGDDEHLERPEDVADVGDVPEDGDDDCVGADDA